MKLYRFESVNVSTGIGQWGESTGSETRLRRYSFEVVKTTPKDYTIDDYGRRRFVLASARNGFARPSESAALRDFMARKTRQIEILEARAGNAQKAYALAANALAGLEG